MVNPFIKLHHEFKEAGADILVSSGQACVLYGIAAFSKDGDWILRENEISVNAVLHVLESKGAFYRFGAPLALPWLEQGWTSHFEYIDDTGFRMRVDLCSRPPRVQDIGSLWMRSSHKSGVDVVDVEDLIKIKQTRRVRDYPIIGSLAEAAGFESGEPELALLYLQDFSMLKKAVEQWPEKAKTINRKAVQLLLAGSDRAGVVAVLAEEQDNSIMDDEKRIDKLKEKLELFYPLFSSSRMRWGEKKTGLMEQHYEMLELAVCLL